MEEHHATVEQAGLESNTVDMLSASVSWVIWLLRQQQMIMNFGDINRDCSLRRFRLWLTCMRIAVVSFNCLFHKFGLINRIYNF